MTMMTISRQSRIEFQDYEQDEEDQQIEHEVKIDYVPGQQPTTFKPKHKSGALINTFHHPGKSTHIFNYPGNAWIPTDGNLRRTTPNSQDSTPPVAAVAFARRE